jgi:multiple sugar transport system substrate-binding protein
VEHTITPVDSWTDFIQKWVAMSASGNAPDLINIGLEGAQMALANNLIIPLDDMISTDSVMSVKIKEYPDSLINGFSSGGRIYGIPNGSQTMVMYYNKAIFDARGVEYPKEGWTWDDFLAKTEKLTYGSGNDKVYGFGLPVAYFQLTPWWVTNNAYPCKKDYSGPDLSNPNMVEALTFITDLVKKQVVPDPFGVDIYSQFAAGKLAMVGAGRWVLNSWIGGGFKEFDCIAWPKNKSSGTVYGGAAWGIGSNSQAKEAAFALLKELVSDETLTATAKLGQQIPPTAKLATEKTIMGTIPDSIDSLWQAVVSSTPVAAPAFFGTLEQATLRAVQNALSGTMDPQQALSQAQAEVEAEL